jgi:hypothetical protein
MFGPETTPSCTRRARRFLPRSRQCRANRRADVHCQGGGIQLKRSPTSLHPGSVSPLLKATLPPWRSCEPRAWEAQNSS